MANEISGPAPSIPPIQTPPRAASPASAEATPSSTTQPGDQATLSREATNPQPAGSVPNFGPPANRRSAGVRAANAEIRERGQQATEAGGERANEEFRRQVGNLGENVRSAVTGDPRQEGAEALRNGDLPGAVRAGAAMAGEKAASRATRGLQIRACVAGAIHVGRLGAATGAAIGLAAGGAPSIPGGAVGGTIGAVGGCAAGFFGTRKASEITGNVIGQTGYDIARRSFSGS